MSCDRPVLMHRRDNGEVVCGAPGGKYDGVAFEVPCQNCKGCLIRRAFEWGIRCVHEAAVSKAALFCTFTLDDEHLGPEGSLSVDEHRNLIRRIRREFPDVRYLSNGEYGDHTSRAHYHSNLFNVDVPMGDPIARGRSGYVSYTCPALEELWGRGNVTVGPVSAATGAYCGSHAEKDYDVQRRRDPSGKLEPWLVIDPRTGEVRERRAPFRVQSAGKGGAIGKPWFDVFSGDVRNGCVPWAETGKPTRYVPAPAVYLDWLEKIEPERAEAEKQARLMEMLKPENVLKSSAYHRVARIATRDARLKLGHEGRIPAGVAHDAFVEFDDE